jgi:hypothetical protein
MHVSSINQATLIIKKLKTKIIKIIKINMDSEVIENA